MATLRTEARFGAANNLGTTYVNIGTVPALTVWNVLLNVANRLTVAALFRAYIADASWTTGEPTGSTLKAAIAFDVKIKAGEVKQISGAVMYATEQIVVRSDVVGSLDVIASGVAIT